MALAPPKTTASPSFPAFLPSFLAVKERRHWPAASCRLAGREFDCRVGRELMSISPLAAAYIVAARRSALGRIGGLHRARRLDELTVPVLLAALADARLAPERVEEIILGNASSGGNPARLIALAAGLPETASASTIDRQCGSGLDAIVAAI